MSSIDKDSKIRGNHNKRPSPALLKFRKFFLFGVVGGFGTVLNTVILYGLTHFAGLYYLLAAAIATETAIVSNFFGNHFFTFRNDRDATPLWRRFLSFQAISLVTLVGTLVILYTLTTLFGETYLLLWNLIAILVMFLANFALNRKFTWRAGAETHEKRSSSRDSSSRDASSRSASGGKLSFLLFFLVMAFCIALPVAHAADIAATSQFGHHPLSEKQVILYTLQTGAASGTFTVNGAPGFTNRPLTVPVDGNNVPTTCQGGLSCLVGDFTDLTTTGTYTITTTAGGQSHTTAQFQVSPDLYADNLHTLFDFFDAERQQGSNYHADMNGFQSPAFPMIADGSFLIQTDQAALATVRLGSAYRRNPAIFSNAMRTYIVDYTDYLLGLRGAHAVPGAGPYRFGWDMSPQNAFIPNQTSITTLQLYDTNGGLSQTVPVTSLCGASSSPGWQSCIDQAMTLYHCDVNEPCLNLTYTGAKGTIAITPGDHTYPAGWMYDWNCFLDARLDTGMFNDAPNPCLMFDDERGDDMYTIYSFAALTQAIPALYDQDPAKATIAYDEAKAIAAQIGDSYTTTTVDTLAGPKTMTAEEKYAWAGMGLFLLYDYSGDQAYLLRAYNYRTNVRSDGFDSGATFGNEFYWEEYIRHEGAIIAAGREYTIAGNDPRELLTGKMASDWENNDPIDISRSGERVFQKMRATGFSISRSLLIEAVYAMKTLELAPSTAPPFTQMIADSQLAWLTGQNVVQDGETGTAPLRSYSFIFGLGQDNPAQYHSRYLIDTGLFTASGGSLLGARGIDYQFMHNGALSWMDGRSDIMGQAFGAIGNDLGPKVNPWLPSRTYANGQTSILGWINGAFDTDDGDVTLNYLDDQEAYLFTESTNEKVAAAVELFAYLDGAYNDRVRHAPVVLGTGSNSTPPVLSNATLKVYTTPVGASIALNGTLQGVTAIDGLTVTVAPGNYALTASKSGYTTMFQAIALVANQTRIVNLTLTPSSDVATLKVFTTPTGATIALDGIPKGVTAIDGLTVTVVPGDYALTASKSGYALVTQPVTLITNTTTTVNLFLHVTNSTIIANGTDVSLATNSSTGATHHLYEIDTGRFWVTLQDAGTVTWLVDGVVKTLTGGQNSTFNWTPGILAVPVAPLYTNTRLFTVVAKTANGNITWTVDVENVLNPFFQGTFGAPDTLIHVFTNNKYGVNFTAVSVTLDNSGALAVYSLVPVSGGAETDWQKLATNLPTGNSWLRKVATLDTNGVSTTYTLGDVRAHYRTPSSNNDNDNSGGGGGRGGGGGFPEAEILQLVYVTFAHDVLDETDSQTITLDARTNNSEIRRVEALLETPSGAGLRLELNLTAGDRGYGTWSEEFSGFIPGEYILKEIDLWGFEKNATKIPVSDRSFYVVGPETGAGAGAKPLTLIYTLLTPSVIGNGTNATLRLDAADQIGITLVTANITTSRGESFQIPLHRVAGTSQYGTWEGTLDGTTPDTTYVVTSITLKSAVASKMFLTSGRSVYVQALPTPEGGSLITGAVAGVSAFSSEAFAAIVAKPIIPIAVGFGIMLVTLAVLSLNYQIKKKLRGKEYGKERGKEYGKDARRP